MLTAAWRPDLGVVARFGSGESTLDDLDHAEILALLREHGFILFDERVELPEFEAFAGSFGSVVWGSRLVPNNLTPLELHSEAAWTPFPPDVIWFHCERPAASGGQTTVCDGRDLWRCLSPEVREYFRRQPLQLNRYWPDGAWQSRLGKESFEEAGKQFEGTSGVELSLLEDGTAHYCYTVSAISVDLGGEEAFSNSFLFALPRPDDYGICLPGGSPFPDEVVDEVIEVAKPLTHEIDWSAGQMAMLDNRRVMHGRRPYEDPQRCVRAFHTALRDPLPA